MMCCKNCPFNPVTGTESVQCDRPLCSGQKDDCEDGYCAANLGSRCFLDYYVISRLYQQDSLAEELAQHSLKAALIGRDRALLLSLFHAASDRVRRQLWQWLELREPRSLWLLNPIFASVGLVPLDTMIGMGSRRDDYLAAIMSNPYSGRLYQNVQMTGCGGRKL
jgi:hypothetical protein